MEYWVDVILLFFVYGFAGWCMEVILKYRQYHRFINRGFLTGPLLPIYGGGAVLITVIIGNLTGFESGIVMTFALSFVICGAVEYFTSLILEKIFHARWWDYSQKPMNLQGRIWIGNLILFGLAGVGIMYIFNPAIYKVFGAFSLRTREAVLSFLLLVFAADCVVSYFVLKLVKVGIDSSEADNTEEISKEVRHILTSKSYFYSRFADAYPDVIYKTDRVKARLLAVKAEAERMQKEAEKKIAASLEPVHLIRADLIGAQEDLIALLYDETTATEEMKKLKAEIDRQKGRLAAHAFVKYPDGRHKKSE
ncbi:MAG: putative ABC transporter permease [Eubacteriales bacterium]|nr:putative ABC transporter permease [Eubacteriales bacterium]